MAADDPKDPLSDTSQPPADASIDALKEKLAAEAPAPLDRYRLGELLGEGGSGQVYRAFDLKLRRNVALKFLSSRDPAQLSRLVKEAQAQARVDHPCVCKVYEIVETTARPFISMQLISGSTLLQARGRMSLRAKIEVMVQVAQAIEEAHHLGIIHRDLKPSNVMLEEEGERFRPFVMDFGLARDLSSTMTHGVVGTPSFMAPEQVSGDPGLLGPHTDVHGLGATLYAVLTGEPPFTGESTMAVLAKVQSEEPRSLRALDATLPRDLEIIVHTCLEKDPRRRYPSARALARDLGAYLRGESILARPESWLSRSLRRARRHRALVAVSALALLVAMVLGGIALEARRNAAARVRLTRELADDSNQIDSILRIASLMPVHDTEPERARIRERMQSISDKMARSGSLSRGPGLAALGRGHLALREYSPALSNLEEAYRIGERAPELEYALGMTLGRVYQMKLAELRPLERERRKPELRRQYRDSALDHLQRAAGARSEAPEYVEGLIAYYDERFEDAADKARAAFQRAGWLFEALQLEGDALVGLAERHRNAGNVAAARDYFERAGEPFHQALAIARSDERIYLDECQRIGSVIQLARGAEPIPPATTDEAVAACDHALRVTPGSPLALKAKAELLMNLGERRYFFENQGCADEFREAIALASRAAELEPSANTFAAIGDGYSFLLRPCLSQGGRAPGESCDQAVAAYQRSIQLQPSARAWRGLGVAYRQLADEARAHGDNPLSYYDKSVDGYRRALALIPGVAIGETDVVWNNLGNVLESRGEFELERGLDPSATLDDAAAALKKADEAAPNSVVVFDALGAVASTRALYQFRVGQDPGAAFAASIGAHERAIALDPTYINPYLNLAEVRQWQADHLLRERLSPRPAIDAARRALERAARLQPDSVPGLVRRCRIEQVAARSPAPGSALAAADAACARALRLAADDPESWLASAQLHQVRAELAAGERGREVTLGLSAVEQALKLHREWAEAFALRGDLEVLRLRLERGPARREAAVRALAAFEQAFQRNPGLRRLHSPAHDEAAVTVSN